MGIRILNFFLIFPWKELSEYDSKTFHVLEKGLNIELKMYFLFLLASIKQKSYNISAKSINIFVKLFMKSSYGYPEMIQTKNRQTKKQTNKQTNKYIFRQTISQQN